MTNQLKKPNYPLRMGIYLTTMMSPLLLGSGLAIGDLFTKTKAPEYYESYKKANLTLSELEKIPEVEPLIGREIFVDSLKDYIEQRREKIVGYKSIANREEMISLAKFFGGTALSAITIVGLSLTPPFGKRIEDWLYGNKE